MKCPNTDCRAHNHEDARFCSRCGAELEAGQETQQADVVPILLTHPEAELKRLRRQKEIKQLKRELGIAENSPKPKPKSGISIVH